MRKEPRRLVLDFKGTVQLVRADALLGRADKVDRLQPLMRPYVSNAPNVGVPGLPPRRSV